MSMIKLFGSSIQRLHLHRSCFGNKGIHVASMCTLDTNSWHRRNTGLVTLSHRYTKRAHTRDSSCGYATPRKGSPFFSQCERTFSLSTRDLSKDQINKYYMFRDEMRLRRKEFYQRFAAVHFVNAAPKSWQPYLRLARVDKPIGTWLLFFPCTFGIALATPLGSLPDFYYLGLFGVGAFLMRGAGCVINDLWDRDLDKHVERTRARPLASGEVTVQQAFGLLAGQLTLSLGILLSLNMTCIAMGFLAMIPVILYPLAKRVTNYPQAVLGLMFNIGVIMGYAAVAGTIYWPTVLSLYFGCFCWTMYYDTIYAMQDMEDDAVIGIKSTALLWWKERTLESKSGTTVSERLQEGAKKDGRVKMILGTLYVTALTSWIIAGFSQNLPFPTYIILGLNMAKFSNVSELHPGDPKRCLDSFMENKMLGLIALVSFIIGVYMGHPQRDVKKKE